MLYVCIAPPCLEGVMAWPEAEPIVSARFLRADELTISTSVGGCCGKLADVDASLRGKAFD